MLFNWSQTHLAGDQINKSKLRLFRYLIRKFILTTVLNDRCKGENRRSFLTNYLTYSLYLAVTLRDGCVGNYSNTENFFGLQFEHSETLTRHFLSLRLFFFTPTDLTLYSLFLWWWQPDYFCMDTVCTMVDSLFLQWFDISCMCAIASSNSATEWMFLLRLLFTVNSVSHGLWSPTKPRFIIPPALCERQLSLCWAARST